MKKVNRLNTQHILCIYAQKLTVKKREVTNITDNTRFETKLKINGELKEDLYNHNLKIHKVIPNHLKSGSE